MIIAPGEGETAQAIAVAARAAGWTVVLARRSAAGETAARGTDEPSRGGPPAFGDVSLPWNPASYVSAGALAIGASSKDEIDALVLVSALEGEEPSLFDGPPGSLAGALEQATAGPVWLSREMLRRFEARKSGKVLAVSVEKAPREGTAPGETAWASFVAGTFRGFGEGLFDRARGARWKAWGIVDKSGKPAALASFAIALIEEGKETKSGRWLSFNGKGGIFGIF